MNLCMGSGTLPEICEHSSPCHPHIQVTALPCKEEAICESSRKIAVFSRPSSFKMERGNVEKNVLWAKIKIKKGEEMDHPAFYKHSV